MIALQSIHVVFIKISGRADTTSSFYLYIVFLFYS
jgi:hypothetical protein